MSGSLHQIKILAVNVDFSFGGGIWCFVLFVCLFLMYACYLCNSGAALVAQIVKNLPAMQETQL